MKVHGDNIFTISTDSNFGKMSFLLNPFVLGAGGGAGNYEAPPITTDLKLHYQASALDTYSDGGITLCSDGDSIQQINDNSGSANHLTQTTGAQQLVFKTDDGQVKDGAYWLGSGNDNMDLTSSVAIDVDAGYTVFMVVRKQVLNTSKAISFGGDATISYASQWWSDNKVYAGSDPWTVVNATNNTNWTVISLTYGQNTDKSRVWLNSGFNGESAAQNFSNFNLVKAFNRGVPASYHSDNTVEYAELLHYDGFFSDTDVLSVVSFLKTRHGIA
jgi:hypothetical protein